MPIVVLNDSLPVVEAKSSADPKPLDQVYVTAEKEVEEKSSADGRHDAFLRSLSGKSSTVPVEGSKVMLTSTNKPLLYREKNHLLGAIMHAYNNHEGLRLSPDDLLHCFSTVVAKCICDNSEKYRDVFVNNAGKERLVVKVDCPPGQFDWKNLLGLMSVLIDTNVKSGLGLESTFSTSTPTTVAVADLMKMCSFKKYFEYGFMCGCGVRKVDLTGTINDWNMLYEKVEKCSRIFTSRGNMVNWSKHFLAVIKKLIETVMVGEKAGKADATSKSNPDTGFFGKVFSKPLLSKDLETFWSRIITYVPYGSGGQQYISGWARVLFPGDKYDKFPDTLNLLDSSSAVPVGYSSRNYEWQDKMANWAQLVGDVPDTLSYVEAELNDHRLVYDLYCTIGHVGFNVIDGFASGELGYIVHAVPKDKPVITAGAEERAVVASSYTATQTVDRSTNPDKYKAAQEANLDFIRAYQKSVNDQ